MEHLGLSEKVGGWKGVGERKGFFEIVLPFLSLYSK